MGDKKLLFDALMRRPTERPAWVPFAGVHAGSLIGVDATTLLTNEDALMRALLEANRLYKPDGQPVLFDLQLEAEALGCALLWTRDCPPCVKTHPLAETMTVPCRCTIPTPKDGRLPLALSATRRLKEAVGDSTGIFSLLCGPFTLASHLRGNDLFMDMYDDADYVRDLVGYAEACAEHMARYYAEAGADVIAVVDPLVSQISAQHFTFFLSDYFALLFAYIKKLGCKSALFVCGDATRNVGAMCAARPDAVFVDENVDLAAAKTICDAHGVAIGGNIPLTSVMLHGSQQANMKYVVDLIDRVPDRRGLIVAPGCDMPYDIPVENAIGAAQAVLDTNAVREMVRGFSENLADVPVDLPDYARLSRPLVEVFTLDSATCAACAYMLSAALEAKNYFGDRIDLVEYKYTVRENIARCKKMGVEKLPSLYVDGALKFSSLIPARDALFETIEDALGRH